MILKSRRIYEYLAIMRSEMLEKGVSSLRLRDIYNRAGVKPSSAHEYVTKLIDEGLVSRIDRGRYTIAEKGLESLENVMWSHGVIEIFFHKVLGLDPDDACKIASKIDYLLPYEAVEKLCIMLGHPSKCPHNQEIPHRGCGEGLKGVFLGCFLKDSNLKRSF
ncbi:MAG: metal-dependent transcriptional regulator [Sulfolobales archaeon]